MKELEEDKRSLQEQLADSEEEKAHWKSRLDSQRIELQQRELSFTTDTESLQDEVKIIRVSHSRWINGKRNITLPLPRLVFSKRL